MRTIVTLAALACAACSSSADKGPDMSRDAILDRAQVVRQCPGGMYVGVDRVSRRLTWSTGWSRGLVAEGVKLSEVCSK